MNEPPSSPSTPPVHVVSQTRVEREPGRARRLFGAHWGKISIGCVIAVMVASFGVDELYAERVPHGVRVLGADLSRLDAQGARDVIRREGTARLARALTLEIDGRAARMKPAEAGVTVDADATAARARGIDRDLSLFRHFAGWLRRFVEPRSVALSLRVNDAALDAAIGRVERETLELPRDGGLRLDGERFVPELPRPGRRIDRAHARRELLRAIDDGVERVRLNTIAVSAPVASEAFQRIAERANALTRAGLALSDPRSTRPLNLEPAELRQLLTLGPLEPGRELELRVDPAAVERALGPRLAEFQTAPVDARFVIDAKDQVHIEPSAPGTRIDVRQLGDAILRAANAVERHGELPIEVAEEPTLTTEGAEKLGIRGLVSTFTTRHPCCERRVENIHRIADLLDGLLVKPGEIVSVNAVVGPRTAKNGFVPAPTIEDGEMVDSVGGGISQFATTLFNALFYGGFDILERQPHTYWFPRYPMGHEATLSYPKPDLVFRNDTESGMLLDTVYTKTTITVRIFGDNGGRKVRAEVSPRQNIVEPPVEIIGNPEVPPEDEHVREAGSVGWTVMVGRILTFPDGTTKEERRKVTYRPRTRRVEVHPCRVPKGEKGYTGERCPQPVDAAETLNASSPSAPSEP